jgi:hypothetical protein
MANNDGAWKIRIGDVFRVPHGRQLQDSGVPSYAELTRGTCSRPADLQKGMFFYASVNEPGQDFQRLPALIFLTNPHKKDTEGTPWIDVVEPDVGYSLFHGDNRTAARSPLDGRGNRKFAEVQHFYSEPRLRMFAPPILMFSQTNMLGARKGYREFCGYGVPVRCTINTQREKRYCASPQSKTHQEQCILKSFLTSGSISVVLNGQTHGTSS